MIGVLLIYSVWNFFLVYVYEVKIYKVLTWKDFQSYVMIMIAFLTGLGGWYLFLVLHNFKVWRKKSMDLNESNSQNQLIT